MSDDQTRVQLAWQDGHHDGYADGCKASQHRIEALEAELAGANAALALQGYGADTHAGLVAAREAALKIAKERADRIEALEAENKRLREAVNRVLWFSWVDNDEDAVAAIEGLRAALGKPQP